MRERMAVIFGERALGRGADMAKDEAGSGLGSDTLQVGAVPGRDGGGKEAWSGSQLRIGVEAYAKAVCVVLASSCIL